MSDDSAMPDCNEPAARRSRAPSCASFRSSTARAYTPARLRNSCNAPKNSMRASPSRAAARRWAAISIMGILTLGAGIGTRSRWPRPARRRRKRSMRSKRSSPTVLARTSSPPPLPRRFPSQPGIVRSSSLCWIECLCSGRAHGAHPRNLPAAFATILVLRRASKCRTQSPEPKKPRHHDAGVCRFFLGEISSGA